jgi:hypothetical protein
MTLNNIITRLRAFAESHKQIKYVDCGDLIDMLIQKDLVYPCCLIELLPGEIGLEKRVTNFAFKIWFCDLANVASESKRNELDVESDLTSIAEDYVAMLDFEARKNAPFNLLTKTFPVTYYTEKFEDIVIAASININIGTMYAGNRCQVPATGVTFVTNNYNMIVQTTVYTGTGTEGQNLTLSSIINRQILMLFKGDKLLLPTVGTPGVNDYKFTVGTGGLEFGNDIEFEQIIQILWKNI